MKNTFRRYNFARLLHGPKIVQFRSNKLSKMRPCVKTILFIFAVVGVSYESNTTRQFVLHCFNCIKAPPPSPSCRLNRCNCSGDPQVKFKVPRDEVDEQEQVIETTSPLTTTSTASDAVASRTLQIDPYIPSPQVHCRETNFIVLAWNITRTVETFYYVVYHVQHRGRPVHPFMETTLTRCGYTVLENLYPDTHYRIELRSFSLLPSNSASSEAVYRRSMPISVWTRMEDRTPMRVNKFWFGGWHLEDRRFTATVKWEKSRDAACYYTLTYFPNGDEYEEIDISNPLVNNQWNITNLDFGTYYPIAITPYTSLGHFPVVEGPKSWINVTSPTCLQAFGQIDDCIPDQPRDLEVTEYPLSTKKHRYNVTLFWAKPEYQPYYYTVILVLIDSNKTILSNNVTGACSNITFTDIPLTSKYEARVVAYSAKGPSTPAVIHRHVLANLTLPEADLDTTISTESIIFIVCPVILVALGIIFLLKLYLARRLRNQERDKYLKELVTKSSRSSTVSTITLNIKADEWEIDTNKLAIKEVLGGGAFGVVRKGFYTMEKERQIEVAIKMLRENPTSEEMTQFYQEIELMKSVPVHPNLVSLIGCVTKGQLLLVVEYCSKGDLQSYLRVVSDKILKANLLGQGDDYVEKSVFNRMYDFDQLDLDDIPQPKDLISFARQVALGMEYLASLKLIHRDLAARNVLLTENNIAKISDFGLSRNVYYDNIYCKSTGGKLPIRWMALESMTHQIYTTQSDVWSFGILLWEIITLGGTPYPGIPTQDIMEMLKGGYRMKRPDNCSEELYSIMYKCWNEQANDRPLFTELRQSLDELLFSYSNYLELGPKIPLTDKEYIDKEEEQIVKEKEAQKLTEKEECTACEEYKEDHIKR